MVKYPKLKFLFLFLIFFTWVIGCGGGRSRAVRHQGYCPETSDPIPQKLNKSVADVLPEDLSDLPVGKYEFESATFFYRLNNVDWLKDQFRESGKPIPSPAALAKLANDEKYNHVLIHLGENRFIHPKKADKEVKFIPSRLCFRGLRVDTPFISESVYGVTDFDIQIKDRKKSIATFKVKKYGFSFYDNEFKELFLPGNEVHFKTLDAVFKSVSTTLYRILPKELKIYERRIVSETPRGAKVFLQIRYKYSDPKLAAEKSKAPVKTGPNSK